MHFLYRSSALGFLAVTSIAAIPPADPPAPKAMGLPTSAARWTEETPDAMLDTAKARGLASSEVEAVAAIATILALADRAEYGRAQKSLEEIAVKSAASADARGEAALAARMLAADEGSDAGVSIDRRLGVATDIAVLGPFRDTGGGLDAKDGPEAGAFADMKARYAWGTVDVAWRAVPRAFAVAAGVPLDVFVHPRKESCSWIATKIAVDKAQPIVVRLAATGQARLMFDGVELGRSKDVHASARLDRLAARVDATAGSHVVAAKVCAGALADDGRVRIRFTDPTGAPLALATSADLGEARATVKIKSTSVVTSLGRALAATGAIDTQLSSAVARTLGGADDLASPRAPGLLATITRTPGLDADRLAMAAWIAPPGANRSGWLGMARARAKESNDARTGAFIARRLIAQHLESRLADWAMAARRAIKLDAATDAEAVLIAARVDQALATDAQRLAAMRSLAAFVAKTPAAPSAVVRELATVSVPFDPAAVLAARETLAKRGETGAAWTDARSARGKDAVVEAARASFDGGGLDGADEAITTARAVARAGAHEAARDLFSRLVRWAPNRAETWAGLADEIAATSPASNAEADGAVQAALRRARALAPGEARYRAQLLLRQRGANPDSREVPPTQEADERYIAASPTILARRLGVPTGGPPDVADRTLHWTRAVVMHADKRVSQMIHYAREIVIAPRTTDELYEEIPAQGEQTEILRARVHRKNGVVAFPSEEHNEGTRPRIRWPELQPGDVVEVAIRSWTGGPVGGRGDPPFYFIDLAGGTSTHPLLYNEVVIESPPDHPVFVDVVGGKADRRDEKDDGGRHIVRLVWDKPPMVADEPLSPEMEEIVPIIVASTFKDWATFRAWYAEAVRGFTEPDAEVKRLAADLTKGKTTREDKLAALFNFVADDIRYVNYQSGEYWLPNRPQQLLARREGDCDDKAMLLITLLRAIGIEAQEVMVQTRITGKGSVLRGKGAAIPLFDHGIAFLPGPGGIGGTYLDATSPQSRLGPLPSMDARASALRLDSGPAEIVELPAGSPDDHGADVTWTITMHGDGSADLAGEEKHSGDGAFYLRTYATEASARAQYVEDHLVGPWFPSVDVEKQIDFKGDLAKGAAWVRYKAKSQGFARHEAADMVVPLSPSATLASTLAPLVRRTLPVALPPFLAPSHESRTIRIVAPKGFAWAAELPPGGDVNGAEFGRAHLEVAKDPRDVRAIIVKRTFVLDQSLIPVDKYGAWRAWLQRVDALMHKGVRLVPEESLAKGGAR